MPFRSLFNLQPNRSYVVILFVVRSLTTASDPSIRTAAVGRKLVAYVCLSAVSRTKATVPTTLTTHSAMLERAPRPPRRHLPIPTATTGAMVARAIATLNPTMDATPTQVADLDAATMIMEPIAHMSSPVATKVSQLEKTTAHTALTTSAILGMENHLAALKMGAKSVPMSSLLVKDHAHHVWGKITATILLIIVATLFGANHLAVSRVMVSFALLNLSPVHPLQPNHLQDQDPTPAHLPLVTTRSS